MQSASHTPSPEWWNADAARRVVSSVGSREGLEQLQKEAAPSYWVEMRIDLLLADGVTLEEIDTMWPNSDVLLTVRCASEGGAGALNVDRRKELIRHFLPRAKALDLELLNLVGLADVLDEARAQGVLVIGSAHNFTECADANWFDTRLHADEAEKVDILKVAAHVDTLSDIEFIISRMEGTRRPFSVMGMGALGPVSRVIAAQRGSLLNYGFVGSQTAPGQWSAALLREAIAASLRIEG